MRQSDTCAVDLSKAFDPQFCRYDKPSRALLAESLQVIINYMDRVEVLRAMPQDDDHINKKCNGLVRVLKTALALPLPCLVRHHVESAMAPIHRIAGVDKFYKNLITCWARYIALVTDKAEKSVDGNV